MIKNQLLPPLDARLRSALSFARPGRIPADVGTDHGYIPISLLLGDACPRAVAADLHPGPLECARTNAERFGVSQRLRLYLSDGLSAIPCEAEQIGDIYICGMGGELIASLLAASPFVRRADVRLILQPMTAAPELRQFLLQNGFRITEEALSADSGHLYVCLAAEFDGQTRRCSAAEALLGQANIARGRGDPLFETFLQKTVAQAEKRLAGRRAGGLDVTPDAALLQELYRIAGKE